MLDKVEELYQRLNKLSLSHAELLLRLNSIRNIIESGMNNEQKLIYIKTALTKELT
jgi:hypothetical protein